MQQTSRAALRRCAIAVGIASAGVPAFAAPPVGAILTRTCATHEAVGSHDCPQLDPALGQLLSVQADLDGSASFSIVASGPGLGPATWHFTGVYSLDFQGGAFYFPFAGSGTVALGPTADPLQPALVTVAAVGNRFSSEPALLARFVGTGQVHLIAIADLKSITVDGGTVKAVTFQNALTKITLTYRYLPRAGRLPPVTRLPPQHLPHGLPAPSVK